MPRAWSATLLQCSTRTWCPRAWRHDATSPIAHTCGALARPCVVADDAVVDLDAAALEPFGGRVRADADDDEIGVEFGAVAEDHLLHPVGSADLGHPDAAAHVDTLGAVQPGHQLADLLAEHRRQRRRLRFDQHDVDAHAAQAGRHLAADESRRRRRPHAAPSRPPCAARDSRRRTAARGCPRDRGTTGCAWAPGPSR